MNSLLREFRLGLVVNPFAGIGGPTGQKGSDEQSLALLAMEGKVPLSAPGRAMTFLHALLDEKPKGSSLKVVTIAGAMGEEVVAQLDEEIAFDCTLVDYRPTQILTTGQDTQAAVSSILAAGVDLLVFVGGDGTARDVCSVVRSSDVVLGVPAGVKMHSGVYAVNPQLAASVVAALMAGSLVKVSLQEVRDIDEQAFRQGLVKSRFFGEMLVPQDGRYIQAVKQGGFEIEEAVLWDISEFLLQQAEPNTLFVMGPGSTTLTLQKNWGLSGTLLGVDVIVDRQLIAADVNSETLANFINAHSGPVVLVVTAIGGQGHIIGRGNQQITAPLLKRIGRDGIKVVATRTKLRSLAQRPLLMDSGDAELDRAWQGYIPVITGFDDVVLYPLGYFADA